MGRIRGARGKGLGLQRAQTPAAHGRSQTLVANPVPLFAQYYLEAARTITALVRPEDLYQRRFPGRLRLRYGLLLRVVPSVVAAGWHGYYLAEQAHRILAPLRLDEAVAAHRVSVCESLRLKQATGNGFF
nr:hypothetical protein [Hymenobacter lapidiphilus]